MNGVRLAAVATLLAMPCPRAVCEPGPADALAARDVAQSVEPDTQPAASRVAAANAELPPQPEASSPPAAENPAAATAGKPWRNSLGMEFVPVPGTNVLFCKWETRVQDYAAFVRREGRKWIKPKFEQNSTHPAVSVTWDDANAFCGWLTDREQKVGFLPPGHRYRLPRDLEWSAAAELGAETGETPFERDGGIKGVYPWGGPWPPPTGSGNYAPNRAVDAYEYTAPVGSFPTNRYGLFDLGGNVAEWCEESFVQGKGDRTLRGGSWFHSSPWHLASSGRDKAASNLDDIRIGFRVVLELQAAP